MQLGRMGCETAPGESAEWTFVVGRGFLAVVPVTTGGPVVAALHALAAEPCVAIEALVALIPLGGADAVDSFAVMVPGAGADAPVAAGVPHDGIPVHAVVRGAIAVDVFSVGGSRRFTDRGIRPWLLAEFQAVTGLVIGSPLAAVPGAHRLGSGQPAPAGIHPGDTLYWSLDGQDNDAGDTVLRPRRIVHDTVMQDTVMQDTVMLDRPGRARPLSTAPAPAATLAAVLEAADQLDQLDQCDEADRPGRYGFRLATGEDFRLDQVYRIGRNPRPRRIPGSRPVELLTVSSLGGIVSTSHLEISQVGDAVVVTDLGSTNGTLVRFALGRSQKLRSGASLTVLPGTTVDIGDGNLIEILPAG